ncbi:MAG: hypothetical protein LUC93_04180 [Planctomycetaceae bacterium]|nr:hypothetical protein [Planctomycetaceae bacterium]
MAVVFTLACLNASYAVDFSKIPDTTKNAKVGQWATYSTAAGMSQKQTITEITGEGDDRVFTVRLDIMMGDNVIQSTDTVTSLRESKAQQAAAMEADPDVKITDVKVNAAGKEIDAVLVEFVAGGITTKMYMSEEIPVGGIVKIESSAMAQPLMEITGYGE